MRIEAPELQLLLLPLLLPVDDRRIDKTTCLPLGKTATFTFTWICLYMCHDTATA